MKGVLATAMLTVVLIPALRAGGSPAQGNGAGEKADCSFSHPQLPGRCNVTVPVAKGSTPQQACNEVLRCINGTLCREAEKYCFNPGVSKTWKLEEAVASRPRVNCGYSNRSSSGWCWLLVPVPTGVTPQEACMAIVPCLNGGPCEGYIHVCDPSNRLGWKFEQVRPAQPEPTPGR
ncbi:MAG TPA: hypothetical protein VFA98_10130 [Thermoanaerobaculia bacterium]|jgi:hypothetical protein|nr:hypothetical protein [Thermoanaerobaculia bacterium]